MVTTSFYGLQKFPLIKMFYKVSFFLLSFRTFQGTQVIFDDFWFLHYVRSLRTMVFSDDVSFKLGRPKVSEKMSCEVYS